MSRALRPIGFAAAAAMPALGLAHMFIGPEEDLLGMILTVLVVFITAALMLAPLFASPVGLKLRANAPAIFALVLGFFLSAPSYAAGKRLYFVIERSKFDSLASRLPGNASQAERIPLHEKGMLEAEVTSNYVALLHDGFPDDLEGFLYVREGSQPPALRSRVFEASLVRLRQMDGSWYFFEACWGC